MSNFCHELVGLFLIEPRDDYKQDCEEDDGDIEEENSAEKSKERRTPESKKDERDDDEAMTTNLNTVYQQYFDKGAVHLSTRNLHCDKFLSSSLKRISFHKINCLFMDYRYKLFSVL